MSITMPNAIIPHPPTELETKDIAELGERTAHPFAHPEPPPGKPPSERPRRRPKPAGPVTRASGDVDGRERPSLLDRTRGAMRAMLAVIRERRD